MRSISHRASDCVSITYENEDQIQIGGYEKWSYDFAPRS